MREYLACLYQWQIFWNAIKSDMCLSFSSRKKTKCELHTLLDLLMLVKVLFIPMYYLANY